MEPEEKNKNMLADYQQTTSYFHALHDVRFKLLAFLPVLSGAGMAVISQLKGSQPQQLALSILGLIVMLGLTVYDQRNTMIYDRMVRRAKMLEKELGFVPLLIDKEAYGGAFADRPGRRKLGDLVNPRRDTGLASFPIIWHDLGLALIYGACIGAWVFLLTVVVCGTSVSWILSGLAFIGSSAFLTYLAKLNDRENDEIEKRRKQKV